MKKVILIIISWTMLGFVLLAFLQVVKHPKTEIIRDNLRDKMLLVYRNFFGSLAVSRKPPMSTIKWEEDLKHNMPIPFASFKRDNWNWFWHLLYGRFSEDSQGWPKRTSQLTREEIQEELIYYYQKPFASFRQRQWDIFWQHILKGKVF